MSPAAAAVLLALGWPDVSTPAASGGGDRDAAVVVGIERYLGVPGVPGAAQNAADFYAYLTRGRGTPPASVTLLRDSQGSVEKMRRYAEEATAAVRPGGTLWFVFVGHGAPARDGKDGVLVGADAQQDADSLYSRSLSQRELLNILARGPQARTVVILDACFSGRTGSGEALVEGLQPLIAVQAGAAVPAGVTVLTAARAHEFAGPLPGAGRPAFSYLVLGALRGWGDADRDGRVTAGEATAYARQAMKSIVKDRAQHPEITGLSDTVIGSGREAGPDLAGLVLAAAPAIALGGGALPRVPELPVELRSAGLAGDADVLVAYDRALKAEGRAGDDPAGAATAWAALAGIPGDNPYRGRAAERALAWQDFAARSKASADARSGDLERVRKILPLGSVAPEHKVRLLAEVARLYGADAVPPLLATVEPPETRAELCRPYVAAGTTEVLAAASDFRGRPVAAQVYADGQRLGPAGAPVKVAVCATRLGVVETATGDWLDQPLDMARATGPLRVEVVFPRTMTRGELVHDKATHLTWTRVPQGPASWEEARRACAALPLEGGRWRLPGKDDLLGIVKARMLLRQDKDVFADGVGDDLWTATPAGSGMGPWVVNIASGNTSDFTDPRSARLKWRCVR